ncbi:amidohydrolase [Cellulomonas rhizosphaerae]|uniref:Amidohydrolase n=1 Tax=Cellulomonas rhizosphaerae TaxID=2293719 RepID=A0A413RHZ9_9CELL|nr:amidohydrolase family protein [Cellulomonas rhizosphaerae]RHA37807.1 amidohydrolase [Cellulomonas rhizosphaerae]
MPTGSALLLRRARRIGHDEPVDLLLRDGRIASLSGGTAAEEVDLDGRIVMPGLWDQHVHLTQWALARRRLDVSSATSAAHAVALVRARVAAGSPRLLVGYGFRDGLWPDVPTVAALDAAAGDVPVVLVSGDLHCAWASSAGLRYLGAPPVDGLLREGAWLPLQGAVDRMPDDESDELVADATRHAAALGVVGVVDFEIADNLAVWRRRAASAPPAVRVRAGVWADYLDRVLHADLHTGDRVAGLVEQGPLKAIVDGSLNTRTAWCDQAYPGSSSHGVLSVPSARLEPLLAHAHSHGLRVAVHAIGDAANRLALDAFAGTGARGSVEHAQLVAPADLPRFAGLGVTASVQPRHAVDDRHVADRHWPGRDAFAYAALHRAGARLALGSDAPVAPLDPWAAIDAAVWRTDPGESPWHPEQRLDVLTALAASVDGRPLGLRVGDPADLVVLDDDPVALAAVPGALRGIRVAGTVVAGVWAAPLP